MNNFRELKVWQRAVEIATKVYQRTNAYPKNELYGLTSQIRRSAVSISSNIAEGAGRKSNKEFCHFLNIAIGSCFELETQLIISKNLNYLKTDQLEQLTHSLFEIQKMLYALIMSLK